MVRPRAGGRSTRDADPGSWRVLVTGRDRSGRFPGRPGAGRPPRGLRAGALPRRRRPARLDDGGDPADRGRPGDPGPRVSSPKGSPTSSMRRRVSVARCRRDWQQVFETNAQASGRLVAACPGAAFVYCSTRIGLRLPGSATAPRGRPARRPPRRLQPLEDRRGGRGALSPPASAAPRSPSSGSSPPTGPRGARRSPGCGASCAGEEVVLHPDAPNNYNPIFEDDYVRLGRSGPRGRLARARGRQLRRQRDGERRGLLRLPRRAGRRVRCGSATTPTPRGRSGPTSPGCTTSSAGPRCRGARACAGSSRLSADPSRRQARPAHGLRA